MLPPIRVEPPTVSFLLSYNSVTQQISLLLLWSLSSSANHCQETRLGALKYPLREEAGNF